MSITNNVWQYEHSVDASRGFVGYDVQATDGSIGKIDAASAQAGRSYLVVDTGFWIFGKKRLIPVGVVRRVDHENERVHVAMTKEQIRSAPDLDEAQRDAYDADYYDNVGRYYGGFGW